jgi:two-component system chemotaxis sensor kinase CheA
MSPINLERFHATFFAESFEGLDGMEADLLKLEHGDRDPELLNAIFRVVHSIKGSAGSLGFDAIANLSHGLESLLDQIRKGQYEPTQDTIDLLLRAIDCLRGMLSAAKGGTSPDMDKVKLIEEQLQQIKNNRSNSAKPSAAKHAEVNTGNTGKSGYSITFIPHANFFHTGNDPLRFFRLLQTMGDLEIKTDFSRVPTETDFDPEACYLSWRLQLVTEASKQQILEVFEWVTDNCELAINPMENGKQKTATPKIVEVVKPKIKEESAAETAADRRNKGRRLEDSDILDARGGNLHVSTEKVDDLVNLVGELVITQTMLKQIVNNFEVDRLSHLESAMAQLERNTRDLQESVMSIRMLPVSFAFGRFARVVRDISLQLGKQVELKISGEQSELDKTVIEKLIDPLTHLVRNALDHGIEKPEVRRELGKPETATLTLHAEHKGGSIVIQVADDGQGINHEKVRLKAVEQGLIKPEEELTADQVYQHILLPGFSTADTVSDLSGRGVGLDVVYRNITDLGGSLEVVSKQGEGTTFIIRLPLTLAILDGMSVAVGTEKYILPLTFIIECIRPAPGSVKTIAGQGCVVEVRGEYVPVLQLHQICAIPRALSVYEGILVLLEAEGKKIALLVDALLGQDQVVIKSLEANYRKVKYIAGATILGEGKVALILDVNSIVRLARQAA